jgi:hypothetical protein
MSCEGEVFMKTQSREISRDQWKRFFDETSRHYRGRTVDLLCEQPGETPRALAREMPFIGCTFEPDDTQTPHLVVRAGDSTEGSPQLVTHIVPAPQHVWMRQIANGGDNAMRIESADGSSLTVEFAAATEFE